MGSGRPGIQLSKVFIPEPGRTVCLRCLRLNAQQLHHEVVDLDVLEPFHYVRVICGRMPALVRV
jgi:hypothetical protein